MYETERRNRILVSVYAYLYEYCYTSAISDNEYDKLALRVNLETSTNRPDLDSWFKENYSPYTGMWIRKHPERTKIADLAYYVHGLRNGSAL